jgi:hypothetical protein
MAFGSPSMSQIPRSQPASPSVLSVRIGISRPGGIRIRVGYLKAGGGLSVMPVANLPGAHSGQNVSEVSISRRADVFVKDPRLMVNKKRAYCPRRRDDPFGACDGSAFKGVKSRGRLRSWMLGAQFQQ